MFRLSTLTNTYEFKNIVRVYTFFFSTKTLKDIISIEKETIQTKTYFTLKVNIIQLHNILQVMVMPSLTIILLSFSVSHERRLALTQYSTENKLTLCGD